MEKRRNFTPEEKAKKVIEVLREEKTLNEIAAEYEIHPNQLSRWSIPWNSRKPSYERHPEGLPNPGPPLGPGLEPKTGPQSISGSHNR